MKDHYNKDHVTAELADFLSHNPRSSIDFREMPMPDGSKNSILAVMNPWDDPTLIIEIPESEEDFIALRDVLNEVCLPKRYSAIIHRDTNTLEVIWTAYKRTAVAKEVEDRSFEFVLRGKSHLCRFSKATDRLLTLAKSCTPISSPGPSEHRNILSLHFFASGVKHPNFDDPVSFFIDIHDLDDSAQLELVRNLNAYMTYYDRLTPRILTHEEVEGGINYQRQRYIAEKFPEKIMARPLDANVLSFWVEASNTTSPVMKFLLCHRILEYTAFNFVEAETRSKIRKIIAAPNVHDRIDQVAGDVAELIGIFKETHDIARMTNLVCATLDYDRLWQYIESQKAFFSKACTFEGGFCVKAVITEKETSENWKKNAVSVTLRALREIRNALSHGQDGATRGTIQPTRSNQVFLRPWVSVIEIVAGDAMMYKDVV
jgi:hypothetical protein